MLSRGIFLYFTNKDFPEIVGHFFRGSPSLSAGVRSWVFLIPFELTKNQPCSVGKYTSLMDPSWDIKKMARYYKLTKKV